MTEGSNNCNSKSECSFSVFLDGRFQPDQVSEIKATGSAYFELYMVFGFWVLGFGFWVVCVGRVKISDNINFDSKSKNVALLITIK